VSLNAALQKTRNLVALAQESRRIAEAAYREGAIPLSQVIDAARALADARQAYARAYFGWKQSLFELTSSTTAERTEILQ
jgi:outer membrane protein TolC